DYGCFKTPSDSSVRTGPGIVSSGGSAIIAPGAYPVAAGKPAWPQPISAVWPHPISAVWPQTGSAAADVPQTAPYGAATTGSGAGGGGAPRLGRGEDVPLLPNSGAAEGFG